MSGREQQQKKLVGDGGDLVWNLLENGDDKAPCLDHLLVVLHLGPDVRRHEFLHLLVLDLLVVLDVNDNGLRVLEEGGVGLLCFLLELGNRGLQLGDVVLPRLLRVRVNHLGQGGGEGLEHRGLDFAPAGLRLEVSELPALGDDLVAKVLHRGLVLVSPAQGALGGVHIKEVVLEGLHINRVELVGLAEKKEFFWEGWGEKGG